MSTRHDDIQGGGFLKMIFSGGGSDICWLMVCHQRPSDGCIVFSVANFQNETRSCLMKVHVLSCIIPETAAMWQSLCRRWCYWWLRELSLLTVCWNCVEVLKGGDGCSLLYLQVKCPQMTVTLATRGPNHLSQGDLHPMVAVLDTMQGGCPETVVIGRHRGCRDLLLKDMQ